MFYKYFVTRTRANGTRTVYGVTGEEPPVKQAGGYINAVILWDDSFMEDIGNTVRLYKPKVEQLFEAKTGHSYDVSETRPNAGNFGEAAHMVAGGKPRVTAGLWRAPEA